MQTLKDIAQQARFAAMQSGHLTQHIREQEADLLAFERAVQNAREARFFRTQKGRHYMGTSGQAEAAARAAERVVREVALQSEIILQRRADAAEANRAMLGIMLGVAL